MENLLREGHSVRYRGPNLSLSRRGIESIVKRLKDPQKIQPGTKMPSFCPGDPDEILGGNEEQQIIALRDYISILSLGER